MRRTLICCLLAAVLMLSASFASSADDDIVTGQTANADHETAVNQPGTLNDLDCDPPAAPVPGGPPNGFTSCDTTPYLWWHSVSGATSYWLQLDDNSNFSSPEINQDVGNVTGFTTQPLDPGAYTRTYYWRVRAGNGCGYGSYSAVWSVTIVGAPAAPALSAPANGSSTCSTTPQLCWVSIVGATVYRLVVDNSSDFSSPEITTTTQLYCYTPAAPLAQGTHYWKVRAENSCGQGNWSAVWSFAVPAVPALSAPVNGSAICNSTPQFCWDAVSYATSYDILVDNNSDFSSPELQGDVGSVTCFTAPSWPLNPGTYYWKVRAGDVACGYGPYSAVWQVTISCPHHWLSLPMILRLR